MKKKTLSPRHSGPPEALPASFLLAQVGSHAASKFAERLQQIHLAPAHAGILRMLMSVPAITQQSLAGILRMAPSRLVGFLDELEARGLIERRENDLDRRRYALHLTEPGQAMLKRIGEIARDHQRVLLAALSDDEQRDLASLLQRIADEQGLTRGVHPGYSTLTRGKGKQPDESRS